jgi:hypothetical protein
VIIITVLSLNHVTGVIFRNVRAHGRGNPKDQLADLEGLEVNQEVFCWSMLN